jgi:hypothetical protein
MLDRFGRILKQHTEQPGTPPPATTPETLAPGDALILEDGRDFLVQSAIDCREELDGRVTEWRWLLLDDGSVLEVLRHALNLYDHEEVLYQGTPPYAMLTGPGDQDGLLRVFEARVRSGNIAAMPVQYEHDGVNLQIRSTGTFSATFNGVTDAEVWSDVSANSGDNVYVKFEGSGAGGATLGLAIWTTHIAFYTGQPLAHADIKGMYSR